MSPLLRRAALSVLCVTVFASTASADELSHYREFQLGNSVATVTAVTRTSERDLKTVHTRPALLQDVSWQPRYMTGAPIGDRDSINEVVFNFVDDQLYRMTVTYERSRTLGLTNEDMVASITALYGAPAKVAVPGKSTISRNDDETLAEWQQADSQVVLRRSRYSQTFALVITSVPLEATARKAREAAVIIDTREAPAREAELAKKRAEAERQAEEQSRRSNMKVFNP